MKPNREIADYLARAIFASGCEPADEVQRIAFKGGKHPEKETDLGGLCLAALRARIECALDKRPRFATDLATPSQPDREG